MEKKELLYEGKAKKVYATDDCEVLIVSYKDDATAFNGLKKGTIGGKGAINNRVTNYMTVSYTHLDVYKRQIAEILSACILRSAFHRRSKELFCSMLKDSVSASEYKGFSMCSLLLTKMKMFIL